MPDKTGVDLSGLCPTLGPEQLEQARGNLERYLVGVIFRISERPARDVAGDSLDWGRQLRNTKTKPVVAPQPLRDVAILLLETGLRLGEALALKWTDIELDAANGKKLGYLFVREDKSKNARRHVSLMSRAQEMLVNRSLESKSEYFANYAGKPYLVTSLDHLHKKLRSDLELPKGCVIHSLRHTFLTRFGEAGADAFTIKKVAGHSSAEFYGSRHDDFRALHPSDAGRPGMRLRAFR